MQNLEVIAALARAHFSSQKMTKVDLVSTKQMLVGLNCFAPGQEHQPHVHRGQDKVYLVLAGEGRFSLGAAESTLREGDLLHCPSEVPHGVINHGSEPLVVLTLISPHPRWTGEDAPDNKG